MRIPPALNPNNRDNVIVAASQASYRQRITSLPEDMSAGARQVALLTSITKAQASTIAPMGKALEELKALGPGIWPRTFLVAPNAVFDWRTAPWREYASSEDFYDRELAQIYGDYEKFIRDHRKIIRGELTVEDAAEQARQRVADDMQRRNQEDRDNQRPVGTNQYSELVDNTKNDVNTHRPNGNSVDYALRRLRKPEVEGGRPDLHQRVLTGELTANAAMVQAGFRKPRPPDPQPGLTRLCRAWETATAEERAIFRAKIEEVEP